MERTGDATMGRWGDGERGRGEGGGRRIGDAARSALSRRDLRTQPGVLTPGIDPKKTPTLTRRIKNRPRSRARKVGLVSSGVLEFCAKSELHPVRGLGMLKGRQDRCSTRVRFSKTRLHENLAPIQGASLCGCGLGVKDDMSRQLAAPAAKLSAL